MGHCQRRWHAPADRCWAVSDEYVDGGHTWATLAGGGSGGAPFPLALTTTVNGASWTRQPLSPGASGVETCVAVGLGSQRTGMIATAKGTA